MKEPVAALGRRIGAIKGVAERPSQFGPVQAFWIDGREFVHFHDEAVIDIRLTRKLISARRKDLKEDARVALRNSDWLTVKVDDAEDVAFALELAKAAATANRRKRGERRRTMPDDKALARRRAWHRADTRDLRS